MSGLVPLGSGLTLKAGKFVTLLGYEVIESPNNLNFSRGYLFGLAVPLTHTGGLASYTFTDWFNVTAGVVLGWDDSKNVNDRVSYTGQFAFTPVKDFTANLNWIAGPEQIDNNNHQRYVLDWVLNYTGFKNWTLGLNVDYGHEQKEAFIESLGTRKNTDATWWGWAGYVAYDWTESLRTAVRQEFFRDAAGARSGLGDRDGPVVDDRDGAVQDLEGAGGAGGVPARRLGREGVPGAVLAAGHHRAGAAAARQEHGHHLGQPLLLVLLGPSMSNEAAWLLLSFAIMVVAMLATLYEKIDSLQKRLDRLEAPERSRRRGASRSPSRRRRLTPGAPRGPSRPSGLTLRCWRYSGTRPTTSSAGGAGRMECPSP